MVLLDYPEDEFSLMKMTETDIWFMRLIYNRGLMLCPVVGRQGSFRRIGSFYQEEDEVKLCENLWKTEDIMIL